MHDIYNRIYTYLIRCTHPCYYTRAFYNILVLCIDKQTFPHAVYFIPFASMQTTSLASPFLKQTAVCCARSLILPVRFTHSIRFVLLISHFDEFRFVTFSKKFSLYVSGAKNYGRNSILSRRSNTHKHTRHTPQWAPVNGLKTLLLFHRLGFQKTV